MSQMFNMYEKIEPLNSLLISKFRSDDRTASLSWAVTEFVDGDHMAFYVDAKLNEFRVATRYRFLFAKDAYSIWEELAQINKEWMVKLSAELERPIILYGKVVGGKYGMKGQGKHIKTVCQYSEYNDFIIHDIKVPEGFISVTELQTLAAKFNLHIAPVLYVEKFSKVVGYPENKLSMLPFMYRLPVNYDNEMKGIVIRPVYDMALKITNKRFIMKKLNRRYVGKTNLPLVPRPLLTPLLMEIAAYMEQDADQNHILDGVLADIGAFETHEITQVAGRYAQNILDNVNYIKYNMLQDAEKKLVNKEISRIAVRKLRDMLRSAA